MAQIISFFENKILQFSFPGGKLPPGFVSEKFEAIFLQKDQEKRQK